VYEGYKIYGPYGSRRKIVALVSPNHRTTMSYARYLMSLHLGRTLTADEEVDHIDDDCTNDVIENLQLLTPQGNLEKQAATKVKNMVTLICPNCGVEFTRDRRFTHLRSNSKQKNPSCCSRSCSTCYSRR
jgi:hypothetical protein